MNPARLAFPQPHQCFEGMKIARSEAFEFGNLLLRVRVLAHWLLSLVMPLASKIISTIPLQCTTNAPACFSLHDPARSAHDANSGLARQWEPAIYSGYRGFCQSNGWQNLVLGTENNANINYAEGALRRATAPGLLAFDYDSGRSAGDGIILRHAGRYPRFQFDAVASPAPISESATIL